MWACGGSLTTTRRYMACSDQPCDNVSSVHTAAAAAAAKVAAVAPAAAAAALATAAAAAASARHEFRYMACSDSSCANLRSTHTPAAAARAKIEAARVAAAAADPEETNYQTLSFSVHHDIPKHQLSQFKSGDVTGSSHAWDHRFRRPAFCEPVRPSCRSALVEAWPRHRPWSSRFWFGR